MCKCAAKSLRNHSASAAGLRKPRKTDPATRKSQISSAVTPDRQQTINRLAYRLAQASRDISSRMWCQSFLCWPSTLMPGNLQVSQQPNLHRPGRKEPIRIPLQPKRNLRKPAVHEPNQSTAHDSARSADRVMFHLNSTRPSQSSCVVTYDPIMPCTLLSRCSCCLQTW
jgi:hypothetical protein